MMDLAETEVDPVESDGEDEADEERPGPLLPARAPTGSPRRLTLAEEAELAAEPVLEHVERPRTRGDCQEGPRPCPFVGCRYHLFLHVSEKTGALKLAFPGLEVEDLGESCALDVADRGEQKQGYIASLLNLTRARTDQIESTALWILKSKAARLND